MNMITEEGKQIAREGFKVMLDCMGNTRKAAGVLTRVGFLTLIAALFGA